MPGPQALLVLRRLACFRDLPSITVPWCLAPVSRVGWSGEGGGLEIRHAVRAPRTYSSCGRTSLSFRKVKPERPSRHNPRTKQVHALLPGSSPPCVRSKTALRVDLEHIGILQGTVSKTRQFTCVVLAWCQFRLHQKG